MIANTSKLHCNIHVYSDDRLHSIARKPDCDKTGLYLSGMKRFMNNLIAKAFNFLIFVIYYQLDILVNLDNI